MNTNCLEGLRCPECKQEDTLQIAGMSLFRVVDDGTESHEDVEWDDTSFARCPECGFEGKLVDFQLERQRIKFRLTLDVEYTPNTTSEYQLRDMLTYMVNHAIGMGGLTGETDAEAERWSIMINRIDQGEKHDNDN